MRISASIALPCSLSEAWEALTRWERQVDWILDADRIAVVSSERSGIGVRLDVHTRVFQISAFTERVEVVGWDPPHRLEIAHGPPVRGRGTWALTPIDAGTRFTWTEDVELGFPIVGAATRIYAPVARRLMARSQRALKALIMASGPMRG